MINKHLKLGLVLLSLNLLNACIPLPVNPEWFFSENTKSTLAGQVSSQVQNGLKIAENSQNRDFLEKYLGSIQINKNERLIDATARHYILMQPDGMVHAGVVKGVISYYCGKPEYDNCIKYYEDYAREISNYPANVQFELLNIYKTITKLTGKKSEIFDKELKSAWPINNADNEYALVNYSVAEYLKNESNKVNSNDKLTLKNHIDSIFQRKHEILRKISSETESTWTKMTAALGSLGTIIFTSFGIGDAIYQASIESGDYKWGIEKLLEMSRDMTGSLVGQCSMYGSRLAHLEMLYGNSISDISNKCILLASKSDIDDVNLPLINAIFRSHINKNEKKLAVELGGKIYEYLENRRRSSDELEVRQLIMISHVEFYREYQDLLVQQNRNELAFDIHDKTKGRTLFDILQSKNALEVAGLPESERLKMNNIETNIVEMDNKILQAKQDGFDSKLSELNKSKGSFIEQRKQLHDRFVLSYPKYASIFNPIVNKSQKINSIASDSVYISYEFREIGEIYIWVNKSNEIPIRFSVKTGPNFEKSVTAIRDLLSAAPTNILNKKGNLYAFNDGGYTWVKNNQERPLNSKLITGEAKFALGVLTVYFGELLIDPIYSKTKGFKNWIISPDKELALIPFDILQKKQVNGKIETVSNLHAITFVQSLGVYSMLKQREIEYRKIRPLKALFAMGNAVYSDGWEDVNIFDSKTSNASSPRKSIRNALALEEYTNNTSPNALIDPNNLKHENNILQKHSWRNLPGTAKEIAGIVNVLKISNGVNTDINKGIIGGDIYTGFFANEDKLKSLNLNGKLKDYKYLLFSAHGYLAKNPSLSAIVLSQKNNSKEVDGYITANEWTQFNIRSELTVLSACETAVGSTRIGEGILGLPYALFVAGNINTVLTLWPVDDDATAEFMKTFFDNLKDGRTYSSALLATKQSFARHPIYSSPEYWAAFVLYGI